MAPVGLLEPFEGQQTYKALGFATVMRLRINA